MQKSQRNDSSNADWLAVRIKALRGARGLKQSEIDAEANLPVNSTSKIERGLRSATAEELVRIARTLGVPLDAFSDEATSFVASEEVKVIEALRELAFADYREILRKIEARIYFKTKYAQGREKAVLMGLVSSLQTLSDHDLRPRTS